MEPRYRFRLFLLTIMVLVGCGTLISRLHEFQIEKRSVFVANVPTIHTVTVREPGVRGIIQDCNGTVLARNRRSYEVTLNLEDIRQSWIAQHRELPDEEINNKKVSEIVHEWILPRLESHGLGGQRFTKAINSHYNTHHGLVPFTYRTDLTYDEFAQLAERSLDYPGVTVTVVPRREYPYGSLACHALGYVSQWKKDSIPEEYRSSRMHYQGDDEGIAGVEQSMNSLLKGEQGLRVYVRNEKNKIIAKEDEQAPRQGSTIELTIDARMQYLVENILRRIGRGAAVVMAPDTGEILCMASVPNFDPNDFVPSISTENWNRYLNNPAHPLINRAISAYTPGSTFKLPAAISGCIHGKVGYHHNCIGFLPFGKKDKIRCWKTVGHGTLGLSESIQRSCNPYFMALADEVGSQRMVDTFNLLGLGRRTGIQLPAEASGMVPGSKVWKREVSGGRGMTKADLAYLAIGQIQSLATPLQMCALTAAIANGGRYYQPRIIRRVIDADGGVQKDNVPIVKADLLQEGLTKSRLEVIRKGMWLAVNQLGGTARRASIKDVFVAAKTGTAQVLKHDPKNSHNAWTVSFAPFDQPRFVVAVMVRNGKSGGAVAGSLTHLILRGLFAIDNGFQPSLTRLGTYQGHFNPIEEIELPEGDLLALEIDEAGETGSEIDPNLQPSGTPVKITPNKIILPSFAPQPDEAAE